MLKSKFERGSSVYKCDYCGKRTRNTGRGEYQDWTGGGICGRCYEEAGFENDHQDYGADHDGSGPQPDDCPLCRGREWWE